MSDQMKLISDKQEIYITRMRADQHKCLPHLASINPTPLLSKKKATHLKNDSEI